MNRKINFSFVSEHRATIWTKKNWKLLFLRGVNLTLTWDRVNRKMVHTIWFLFDLIRFICVHCLLWNNNNRNQTHYRIEELKGGALIGPPLC